jgi:Domain of unknown function (DUF3854)/Protein of unknown function (DUF3631)
MQSDPTPEYEDRQVYRSPILERQINGHTFHVQVGPMDLPPGVEITVDPEQRELTPEQIESTKQRFAALLAKDVTPEPQQEAAGEEEEEDEQEEDPPSSLAEGYLAQRGITMETAKAYGLELDVLPSGKKVKERLSRGLPKSVNEVIWFPIYGQDGSILFHIARVLPTITLPDGKKLRFLCPLGSEGAAFIPKQVWEVKKRTDAPVFLTEGPPKGLVLCQAGAFPIAINGVWMAVCKNGDGKYVLRPELTQFQWIGRQVYLCFDADWSSNENVLEALIRTAFVLSVAGAQVFQLTTWLPGDGKGIDDYLAAKAGTDPNKQKQCLDVLLMAAKPFLYTLRPFMLPLVETELGKVAMSGAQRSQLCKLLAGPLEVRATALEGENFASSESDPQLERPYRANYEPWSEPVDAVALFSEIEDRIKSEAVTSPSKRSVCALWIMFSWVHDQMDFSPLLYITGPTKECGKTSLATVIGKMVKRPLTTDNISPPVIFRLCQKHHPCFILDEAQDYSLESDFWTVLKSGHTPDKPALRCHPTTNEPEEFDTFCPKLVAGIGLIGGGQILSRSIIIEMERKGREKLPRPLKPNDPVFITLRRKLARWAADAGDLSRFSLPEEAGLSLRNADNWEMLYRVACAVNEATAAQLIKDIAVLTEESSHIDYEVYLLEALRDLYHDKGQDNEKGFLGSEAIVETLNKNKEGPWYRQKDGLTVHALGRKLGKYKVKSDQVWQPALEADVRGYHYKDLEEKAFRKYLLPRQYPPGNRGSV